MASKPLGSAASPSFVPLPGSRRELLPHSRAAGSIDHTEVTSLTVRTRSSGDLAALEQSVQDLYQAPLGERQYLSREELAQRHGARTEDFDAIEAYAQQHNLMVSHRNAAERTLVITGRLGNLLSAFHASVHMFHHSTGTYRGRRGAILIPK